MSKRTSLEDRMEMMEKVEAGETDKEIAVAREWCERTVFKWRRRVRVLEFTDWNVDF